MTRSAHSRVRTLLVALAATTALTACAGDADATTIGAPSAAAAAGAATGGGPGSARGGAGRNPAAAPRPSWQPQATVKRCIGLDGRDVVTVNGPQGRVQLKQRRLLSRTTIDARTATWTGEVNYPILLDGAHGACLSGPTAIGSWPRKATWKQMHDVAALRLSNPGSIIEDVRFDGYGDAIRVVDGAQRFLIRRAYLSYLRDDCIENDFANSGTLQDSLLDGCYNAFSSRQYDGMDRNRDGSQDTWLIRDTLVRLQPMPSVYKNRGRVPGHAGFFKWDREGPALQLVNNVFRADQDANTVGLDIPLDKLGTCSGNIMVWLGSGPYPGTLPPCFTLTRDVTVWDDAVRRWKAAHGY